ncbi:MAG: lauroyl acyltransferase [Rhodospirillales bacterium]|nr:lauroyl acyltransferase [Rhodospirillales bacterium]MDE2319019.1 lauroyl acyltransferase [Rhodospirillales bacterium]
MSAPAPSLAHRAEAKLVRGLIRLLSMLPPTAASRLGGAVAGFIGPFLPVTRKVGDANLRLAMPELSAAARKAILRQVWRNLGQTIAELVCLRALREVPEGSPKPGYTLDGWDEHVAPHLAPGRPALFFTGHIANWEVMPLIAATKGVDFGFMYRAPSNRLVDEMLGQLRRDGYDSPVQMFAKGAAGARAAYAHVRNGGALGFLVDQKLDTGLAVPFFGKPAMTMDALASFGLRLRCPVFPIHVKRLGPARLHVACEPPVALPDSGDRQADALALTAEVNRIVEGWVREAPGDWLWLHRRWPKGTA